MRAIPGVADAAPRYVVQGADSFALGEPVKLLAFPGDHTRFEDPPLAAGRRLRGRARPRSASGWPTRSGIARARRSPSSCRRRRGALPRRRDRPRARRRRARRLRAPRPLLAADPGAAPQIVVRLRPGADRAAVARQLRDLGAQPAAVGGATTRNGDFLGMLAALLRVVALIDALVCLYALAQSLALDRARAAPDARAAARRRRRRARPSARCSPARRSRSRCPRRCSRSRSSAGPRARSSGAWPPATPTSPPRPPAGRRARRRRPRALALVAAAAGSRAGPSPSRPSRGCGRNDAGAARSLALVALRRRRGLRRRGPGARRAGGSTLRATLATPTATAS